MKEVMQRVLGVLRKAATAALVCAAATAAAQTTAVPRSLRVVAFEGGWNLPVWAAQAQGFFEANGVTVQLSYTPNSAALVKGLHEGRYEIALATIDNFIAYQEGQGEAKLEGEPDFVAVLGGDGGFLSVVGAAGVASFRDLRGKTLSVDAMTTGLAFVLRELVARAGLSEADVSYVRVGGTSQRYQELVAGKHAATLLRTPYELLAGAHGLAVLGTAEMLGPYQGTVAAVRRGWARENGVALTGFIRGYLAGAAWVHDKANRSTVEALLAANVRELTPALASRATELLLAEPGGIRRDGALDRDGIRTVLALRSKYGSPPRQLADPAKYVDETWLRAASSR